MEPPLIQWGIAESHNQPRCPNSWPAETDDNQEVILMDHCYQKITMSNLHGLPPTEPSPPSAFLGLPPGWIARR